MADINKNEIFASDLNEPLVKLNAELKTTLTNMEKMVIEAKQLNTAMKQGGTKEAAANTNKLKQSQAQLNAATKETIKAAASLQKQRERGLAAMAKQEHAERELVKASKMEAKSYDDMSKKMAALNKLRKKQDLQTTQGRKNYAKMTAEVNRLNTSLKSMDKQGGNHQRNVGNYFKQAYVASAAAIMGVFMALRRVAGAVKESVSLYLEQQKQTRLVSVVFGDYSKTINDAANATQKLTTVGNEQYQALAIQASNFGVAQDKVNEAVQGSIGLAAKFEAAGLSQETALKGLALAMQGDFTQLQRYIPALKTATTEGEKMALVQEAMASGFNLAQEQAKTEAGQLEQLKNTTGDVKERFGELVMKGLKPVIENLQKFMQGLDDDGKFARLVSNIKQGIKFIIAFIVGLKAYAIAQSLAAKAGEKFTFSLNGVKNTLKGMKSALAGAGFGVFLVAVTAIVSELSKFIKNMRTSADVSKTVNERMQESTTSVNALFDAIENENTSQEDRIKLMNEVNNRYGEYLPFLLTEENYLENIAIAREKVLDGIRREIEMTARQEKAAEVYKQILDIEEEIAKIGAGGGLRTAILGQSADLEIRLTELSKLYETYNSLLSDVTDAEIESITSAENLTDSTENLSNATEKSVEFIKEEIQSIDGLSPSVVEATDAMAEFGMQLRDIPELEPFSYLTSAANTFLTKINEVKDKYGQEIGEIWNAGGQIADNLFARKMQQVDAEWKAESALWDKRLAAAEGDEEAQTRLLAQKTKAEEEYNRKQVQMERRMEVFKRAQAIFEIALNTAIAITAALAEANPVLAIAAGVAGAAQTAAVLTAPMPQYAEGIENVPYKHDAIVGEKGREIIQYPDGSSILASSPMVTTLPKGASVIPNFETEKILQRMLFSNVGKGSDNAKDNYDMNILHNDLKSLERTLKRKPVANINSGYSLKDINYIKTYDV